MPGFFIARISPVPNLRCRPEADSRRLAQLMPAFDHEADLTERLGDIPIIHATEVCELRPHNQNKYVRLIHLPPMLPPHPLNDRKRNKMGVLGVWLAEAPLVWPEVD